MRKILYILALIVFVLCINKINAYTEYKIGDEVNYNNVDYYVIKNSSSNDDTITLLKAEPLIAEEIKKYSQGSDRYYVGDAVCYHTISGNYETSFVKIIVDAWKNAEAPLATEARLITLNDLTTNLGYEYYEEGTTQGYRKTENTPIWVYNSNYW